MFKVLIIAFLLSSCALVGIKPDVKIDPWIGLPVGKLDSHTIFLTTPYETRKLDNGIEVRNYTRSGGFTNAFGVLSESICNHLFYIKQGTITDHKTVGSCRERLPES